MPGLSSAASTSSVRILLPRRDDVGDHCCPALIVLHCIGPVKKSDDLLDRDGYRDSARAVIAGSNPFLPDLGGKPHRTPKFRANLKR